MIFFNNKINRNTIIFVSFITIFFGYLVINSNLVRAQGLLKDTKDMDMQAAEFADKAGYERNITETGISKIVNTVIKAFLSLLGVIFIILIILAGYNWMTAAGEEEKVRKAKDTILRAIIGLLIIVAAYAITEFVFRNVPFGSGGGNGGATANPS